MPKIEFEHGVYEGGVFEGLPHGDGTFTGKASSVVCKGNWMAGLCFDAEVKVNGSLVVSPPSFLIAFNENSALELHLTFPALRRSERAHCSVGQPLAIVSNGEAMFSCRGGQQLVCGKVDEPLVAR